MVTWEGIFSQTASLSMLSIAWDGGSGLKLPGGTEEGVPRQTLLPTISLPDLGSLPWQYFSWEVGISMEVVKFST